MCRYGRVVVVAYAFDRAQLIVGLRHITVIFAEYASANRECLLKEATGPVHVPKPLFGVAELDERGCRLQFSITARSMRKSERFLSEALGVPILSKRVIHSAHGGVKVCLHRRLALQFCVYGRDAMFQQFPDRSRLAWSLLTGGKREQLNQKIRDLSRGGCFLFRNGFGLRCTNKADGGSYCA